MLPSEPAAARGAARDRRLPFSRSRLHTSLLAALLAAGTVAAGVWRGVPVAGGADASGYVSQAHLWATGTLHLDTPLMGELADLVPREGFAPLGYRPAPAGNAAVPVYSPGLPMLMAVFERLAGAAAAFLVVPLLGGLAVWATCLLGRRLGGEGVGIGSAVLLATSPAFAAQLMFPESDVAVTAWWALCLALLVRPGGGAAFASGLAAGAAILTRPNLVPLALVPGIWLVQHAMSTRHRAAARDIILFTAGTLPACLVVAALNAQWYGSPLVSGYGTLHELFSWTYAAPNLARYPRWLLQSATPVVLLALAAPLLVPRFPTGGPMRRSTLAATVLALAFVFAVFGCYLFYLPWEDAGFLRFLLPAFPPLLVLTTAGLAGMCAALPRRLGPLVTVLVIALVAARGSYHAMQQNAALRRSETRYGITGRYVASRLPPGAVVLSMQHSGSVRYYSGLPTIRYDTIPPANLDQIVDRLSRAGRHAFILLDEGETPVFRERFAAQSPIGRLDWPPVAQLRSPRVVLYDTAPAQVNGDVTPVTDAME